MSDDKKSKTPKDTHYANLRRAFRDQKAGGNAGNKPGGAPAFRPRPPVAPGEAAPDGLVRLYGIHTVRAALDNPRRKISRMLVTRNAAERLGLDDLSALPFKAELVEPREIDRITGSEAVHQGVVIEAKPLNPKPLDALGDTKLVVVLDQVTDPHNVGAIMRSAVAFGAGALITTQRHSPQESACSPSRPPARWSTSTMIEVKNLADALGKLHDAGFQTVGLDSDGPAEMEKSFAGQKIALVLGAEGKGLRQKTRETVTALARLDMPGAIRSLNVSNAAAVALYAARKSYLGAARSADDE